MGAKTGDQIAVKHAGAGAEKRIATDKEFIGLAAEVEKQVAVELADQGPDAIIKRQAIRFQTVADLYYAAILGAAAEGDMVKLERYVNKFGWIQAHALRAMVQVRDQQQAQAGKLNAVDVLAAIKEAANGNE